MKLALRPLFVVVFLGLLSPANAIPAYQAPLPPTVDLGIANIGQQTQVWCWAAVAQQIISYLRGAPNTPAQCALVAIANGSHPGACCDFPNPSCVKAGSLSQIQGLIAHFGGRFAAHAPPTSPDVLYRTLASGRPIILHVRTGPSTTHVIVLRGMSFERTPFGLQPMLHVNDPLALFPQRMPFHAVAGAWIDAIVVQ